MLRCVTVGVALAVLGMACALIPEPAPVGTVPVQITIDNASAQDFSFAITTPDSAIPGAVRPTTTAPGHSLMVFTFYIPSSGDWAISYGEEGGFAREGDFTRERLRERLHEMLECRRVYIDITPDGVSLDLCTPGS